MAFCPNCGSQLNGATPFCPNCGASLTASAPQQAQQPQYQQPQYGQQPQYQQSQPQQPVYQQQPIYQQPQYVQTVYAVKPTIPGRGFGIASMILGIIGIVEAFSLFLRIIVFNSDMFRYMTSSVVMIDLVFEGILGFLAVVFAVCAFARRYKRGQPVSGMILGLLTLLLIVFSIIVANA